jgi:hypothetical protein
VEAALRRIEGKLGTLPDDAPTKTSDRTCSPADPEE